MVVDLAVEGDHKAFCGASYGLVASGAEIHHGKALVGDSKTGNRIAPQPRIIRAAMPHISEPTLQQWPALHRRRKQTVVLLHGALIHQRHLKFSLHLAAGLFATTAR